MEGNKKSEYFERMKRHLRSRKGPEAVAVLREGLAEYPSDPFLLSYYGCLIAVVEHNARVGMALCREAIERLDRALPFGSEFYYPVFYLNLGRACLSAGDRDAAVKAFARGLKADPENKDLLSEMKKLGVRRKPPVPFLNRSNPINKYIGILMGRGQGT